MTTQPPAKDANLPALASSMLDRTAMALLRVDLGLLPPRARQQARDYLKNAGTQFDGTALVDLCLEGRAGDGTPVLKDAMLALRSRLIGIETAVPRRRPSMFVRMTATFTAKAIFFGIYTFLILVAVVLVKRNWPSIDVYAIAANVASFFNLGG